MQKDGIMKLLFFINPVSGGKEKQDWENRIREYFKNSPHNMDFFLLNGENDEASIKHHINSVQPDRVVGVGGDGTIKIIAEVIKGGELPLGIIPAGSANGMAKELGIPADVDAALDIAVNGVVKAIDYIKINDEEYCLHLSDIGLNAMLVKSFESSKSRGMWGYGQAVFKMLYKKQKMSLTIKTDTEIIRRHAYMVVIANATKYGTGAIINPDGDVADGKLEAVVVRKINLLELFKILISHKPFHPNRVEVFSTKKLEITSKHRAYFQVDGEYRGRIKTLKAEIVPSAIKFMVPKTG
jgi:YegS/Rv2252/BmrU family lipid kinase